MPRAGFLYTIHSARHTKFRMICFFLIRQPRPRLPKPRPFWAMTSHLLTLFALLTLFLSGCTGIVGSVKTPPSSPAPPSPTPPPTPEPPPVSPPSITSNPASQTVTVCSTAVFVVAATGTAPLFYQWQKNGVAIPGATLPTYVTPPTRLTDDGSIFVAVVSNTSGSLMSSPAMLNVAAGTARLTADASTLSFGNVVVSASSTTSITLTNSGNASATISGVSVLPPAFAVVSSLAGFSIAPGQSTSVSLQFTPPSQTAFSGAISIISDATNSPISIPVSGTGVASPSHSVDLSWNPSATPNIVGYVVQRADQSGGPYTQLTATPIAATTFTDTTVRAGQTYFYIIIVVDSTGQTSAPSNEAAVTIPSP